MQARPTPLAPTTTVTKCLSSLSIPKCRHQPCKGAHFGLGRLGMREATREPANIAKPPCASCSSHYALPIPKVAPLGAESTNTSLNIHQDNILRNFVCLAITLHGRCVPLCSLCRYERPRPQHPPPVLLPPFPLASCAPPINCFQTCYPLSKLSILSTANHRVPGAGSDRKSCMPAGRP